MELHLAMLIYNKAVCLDPKKAGQGQRDETRSSDIKCRILLFSRYRWKDFCFDMISSPLMHRRRNK